MAAAIGIVKSATESVMGIGEVSIDNFTFKLFYKWSVTFFVAGSVAVSASQFFGDPIACETADDSVDEEVLNSYCWMYASFDIPPEYEGSCTRRVYDSTNLYHTYYQFVSVFLVVQAVLMYLPRCIWLSMEGGLMQFLVAGNTGRVVEDSDKKKHTLLLNYREHVHNKFNRYAFCFFFCELLNILILVTQVFVTNAFLNYRYMDYGYQVYKYYMLPPEERQKFDAINPMCEVFAKVASCNYVRYGRGGGQERKAAICILSLNIINDKVFVALWYWHAFLLVVGFLRIMSRAFQLASARVRFFLMRTQMHRYFNNNKQVNSIRKYLMNCSIGDWFVLYQMCKNVNTRFFAEFLALISLTTTPDPDEDVDPEIDISEKLLNGGDTIREDDSNTDNNIGDDEVGYGKAQSLAKKSNLSKRGMNQGRGEGKLNRQQKGMMAHVGLKAMRKK